MPRKGENIYKRKDGRWEGRYIRGRTPSGKAKYGFVYGKTYRQAKVKLLEAAATKQDTNISHPNYHVDTFAAIAQEWFETTAPQIKASSGNKYWNLLNTYLLPEFADQAVHCITHQEVEDWCNRLLSSGGRTGKGLSPKTVSDALSVLRGILAFAVKKGLPVSCDAESIHIKRPPKEMRVLTRGEQERLCRYLYANLDIYNIGILLCLFTGVRLGELCALCWRDVSFSDHTIHVHQTMQRIQDRNGTGWKTRVVVTAPKSPCSVRTIPVPDLLLQILAPFRSSPSKYVLSDERHPFVEPRTMQNRFKRALKQSQVAPANFHALRHTFATRCVELGFDVKSLSEILGHASVTITMNRYVHPSMELKKENMQRLSQLLAVK